MKQRKEGLTPVEIAMSRQIYGHRKGMLIIALIIAAAYLFIEAMTFDWGVHLVLNLIVVAGLGVIALKLDKLFPSLDYDPNTFLYAVVSTPGPVPSKIMHILVAPGYVPFQLDPDVDSRVLKQLHSDQLNFKISEITFFAPKEHILPGDERIRPICTISPRAADKPAEHLMELLRNGSILETPDPMYWIDYYLHQIQSELSNGNPDPDKITELQRLLFDRTGYLWNGFRYLMCKSPTPIDPAAKPEEASDDPEVYRAIAELAHAG